MNFDKRTAPIRRRTDLFGQISNAELIKNTTQSAILALGGFYESS